jgi:hypothetical protein
MNVKLRGWSFVAATLTLLGSPTVLHAAGPDQPTSEVRSSTTDTLPGPIAADAVVGVPPEDHTVTTVTTVTREPVTTGMPAKPSQWSSGTVTHGVSSTTIHVTTTVRSSPYTVHHHHHSPPPMVQPPPPPRVEPEPGAATPLTVPRYGKYPYATGTAGYVERVPWVVGNPAVGAGSPPGRLVSGQASIETGHAGHGVLRNGAKLRLAWWRLGVDGDVSHFLDRSASERPREDALTVARANVLFAPVLRPRMTLWVGAGTNAMVDMRRNADGRYPLAYGYNLTSSVDVFPVRPLVVSGRMDVGRAGDAPVIAARGTAGLMMNRVEVYGGYEMMRIGDRALRGPMFGLRVWF